MRNQWRLLLLRRQYSLSAPNASSRLLAPLHHHGDQVCTPLSSHSPAFSPSSPLAAFPKSTILRYFSSEPAPGAKASDHSTVIDIFSKSIAAGEIKQELDSKNIDISHDLVLEVLKSAKSDPDVAIKFFDWVRERHGERLSSNSYNLMVGILGSNGFVKEFWEMVESMTKMGYGVKKGAYDCVLKKFEKEGLESDLQRLKGLFDYRKPENSVEVVSQKISKVIRASVWGEDVETKHREIGVSFSPDLVKSVVESLATEPSKALIFFRWVEESGLFKHDEQTFNAMAVVLGREDCADRFWNVVGEMKGAGYDLQMDTFIKVLDRFIKRKMIKDCVDLYEIAMMNRSNKPSIHDCTFLLRKIVVAQELNLELFFKAVKILAESGSTLPDSSVKAIIKSLASVSRLDQSNKILDAMMAAGVRPSARVQANIGFRLSRSGKTQEASDFMRHLEASEFETDLDTWVSLFRGHCLSGDLSNAYNCFQKLVESNEVSSLGYDLEFLVDAYCRRGKAVEASRVLTYLVKEKGLVPKHSSYKSLISQLLAGKAGFKDALGLLDLMKGHGFPPYVDPFVSYVTSKRGYAEDAIAFLKAMTVNRFPSKSMFVRVFEAYFNAGRAREAKTLLGLCPQFVRDNADVLNLFYDMKTKADAKEAELVSAS